MWYHFFFLGPFAFVLYYGLFGFGIGNSIYTSTGVCGFVIGLHKGWIRSSLIYIYNAVRFIVCEAPGRKITKLIFKLCITSPPKPHAFVSTPLQSNLFSYINFKDVFVNFCKNFLKYVIFILPFILVFKALYSCLLNGV